MPYAFSDWEHCTDHAGNARTLDWSEAGMRGQPPGLYLEALRQAAVQRHALQVAPSALWTAPDAVAVAHAITSLRWLCQYIDGVAWAIPTVAANGSGWIPPDSMGDLSGEIDAVRIESESDLLAAAGLSSRVAMPATSGTPRGQIMMDGAWLRGCRAAMQAKSCWWSGSRNLDAVSERYRQGRVTDGSGLAAAIALYNAAPWTTTPEAGFSPAVGAHLFLQNGLVVSMASRCAKTMRWTHSGLLAEPLPCSSVDIYIQASMTADPDTWECADYDLPSTGVLLRVASDQTLDDDDYYEQEIGYIDPITGSTSFATLSHGWNVTHKAAAFDFRGTWPLA
ncbi:MAG: hypothetical protein GX595_14210 [Lentisphaerae bacterium]|nr:hypothetical protein [Lentisphaerota bacterium]